MKVLVFWVHCLFIGVAVVSGLFLPLPIPVATVIVHRLHVMAFNGCLLSVIDKRIGTLPPDTTFLQHAVQRFTGLLISNEQSTILDYSLVGLCLLIALTRFAVVRT